MFSVFRALRACSQFQDGAAVCRVDSFLCIILVVFHHFSHEFDSDSYAGPQSSSHTGRHGVTVC